MVSCQTAAVSDDATISVARRVDPSPDSQLRCWSRPSTATAAPLRSVSAAVSAMQRRHDNRFREGDELEREQLLHSLAMDSEGSELLTELQRPDEVALRFTPGGLGFSVALSAEDAARFQVASIARAVLADDVPNDVRYNVERARKLHCYGVLE
jgi:hypothetical protein